MTPIYTPIVEWTFAFHDSTYDDRGRKMSDLGTSN